MNGRAERADRDIQAVLRAEITDLQFRHKVEIALLHATYSMVLNGSAPGVPEVEQQVAILSGCSLFDARWYLQTYPDVADCGVDPTEHYVCAGAFEGRNPGPEFESMAYYLANPDVAEAGWPALVHFAQCGEAEGRARS